MIVDNQVAPQARFGDVAPATGVAANLLTGLSENALLIGAGLFGVGLLAYLARRKK